MAQEPSDDDPFEWGVNRVIQELCTTNRIWRPSPRAKLPNPNILAQRLRDGDYDGDLLLSSAEDDVLDDLGLENKPRFRTALKSAISYFKRRSPKYMEYMESQRQTDSDTEPDDANHNQPYQRQSEAPLEAITPVSDNGEPAAARNAETVQDIVGAMDLDKDSAGPPNKKRRLATSAMITADRASLPHGQPLNISMIPTEADNLSFLPIRASHKSSTTDKPVNISRSINQTGSSGPDKNLAHVSNEAPIALPDAEGRLISKPGAYWGPGSLRKTDIIDHSTTVDADPNKGFSWGEPKPFGKARKQFIYGTVQRYLLHQQERRSAPKVDHVLPIYGESDSEDDNPEWIEVNREIQEEEEEVRLEKQKVLVLEPSEVDACLQQMVDECAARWHEMELPNEKYKAYEIWKEVRRYGTLRTEVKTLSAELQKAMEKLEETLQGLKDNQYSSEEELRTMSPWLEPRVMPMEHMKWLIRMLNNPDAPERVARPAAPVRRQPNVRSVEDSIDIWSEDEMRDFIVDDDLSQRHDALPDRETLMDAMDIDQPAADTPTDPAQSFVSSTDENIEMHDLTSIDHESDVTDQVLANLVTPQKHRPASSHASPASEEPPLSDWQAILKKGSVYWESMRDMKRLIIYMIWSQSPANRRNLFEAVKLLELEECWREYIEHACKNVDKTYNDKVARDKILLNTALLLIRLFYSYVTGSCKSLPALQAMGSNASLDWARVNRPSFDSFWEFLNLIAVDPEAPLDAVTAAAEHSPDNVQGQLTPSIRRKRLAEEDVSGQLRERDKRRQQEQQARRLQLRQQVEGSNIPQERSRLIINESKLDGQNLVYIHPHIAPLIKDHQIDGVRFMWDQLLSVSESNQGCLLAHTMGLGKTMQVVTLLTAIQEAATSSDIKVSCQVPDHLKESRTLILCPAGLLNNWMDELLYWAPEGLLGELFSVDSTLTEVERADTIRDWAKYGGVLVIGYTMLTQMAKRSELLQMLLDKPSIVVADEAHHLKNRDSKKSEVAARFKTHSRLALTGSPLANNVEEYHAMIQWVAPDFLGDKEWFSAQYGHPISIGLYKESPTVQRRKAKIRLAALRQIVAPKVHRRTVGTLKDSLPPKKEFIIHLDLTPIQKEVYLSYLRGCTGIYQSMSSTSMWDLIKSLGILLAHPTLLQRKLLDMLHFRQQVKEGLDKANFADSADKETGEGSVEMVAPTTVEETLNTLVVQQGFEDLKASFKMLVLFKILDEAAKLDEKVLVFSQSLSTLDFIQKVCTEKKKPYMRLDGNTKVASRQSQVKDFNQGKGQVYLISTTAGGVGLNIYGASRVVIFDFQFNPVHEQQAIGRSYRIGQTKPVFVYWLICDGTFEKVLHNQQVFKNQLASGVVDKKDLLPKASQLTAYFVDPQQVEHEDLSAYQGQDCILDALLASSEVSKAISSICTTDTFEEEDEQQLAAEDQRAAADLARQTLQKEIFADEQTFYYQPPQQHSEVRLVTAPFYPTSTLSACPQAPVPEPVPNAHYADITMQAIPTGTFYHTPSPQVPIGRQHPGIDSASHVVPDMYTPVACRVEGVDGSVNSNAHPIHAYGAPNRNPHTLEKDILAQAGPPSSGGWNANHMQQPVQLPSNPVARPTVTGEMTHAGFGSPMAVAPGNTTVPQGISPVIPGAAQEDHAPMTAGSGTTFLRQDNAPKTIDTTLGRPNLAAAAADNGMSGFEEVLKRQAPSHLKHQVSIAVKQIQQHNTGGGIQRSLAWTVLKDCVNGRPDRAEVIIRGLAPIQTITQHARDANPVLGSLLDGASQANQPHSNRDTRDPDVWTPPSRFNL